MRHEDYGFGTMLNCVLDGRERADDALVVGDFLVGVEGDIEVNLEIFVRAQFERCWK